LAQVVVELLLGIGIPRVEPPNTLMHRHVRLSPALDEAAARGKAYPGPEPHAPRAVPSCVSNTATHKLKVLWIAAV
jgi:hypothetical protein